MLTQSLFLFLEKKQNVTRGHLARKALFSGSELFAKVEALICLHDKSIDTKAPEDPGKEVCPYSIHFWKQKGLIAKTELSYILR
jgi:hypothetical protein